MAPTMGKTEWCLVGAHVGPVQLTVGVLHPKPCAGDWEGSDGAEAQRG